MEELVSLDYCLTKTKDGIEAIGTAQLGTPTHQPQSKHSMEMDQRSLIRLLQLQQLQISTQSTMMV